MLAAVLLISPETSPMKTAPRFVRLALATLSLFTLAAAPPASAEVGDAASRAKLQSADLRVRAVFHGDDFPGVGLLSGEQITDLIGPHAYQVTYLDNDYQEVAKPAEPGRYAAVVTVTPQNETGEPAGEPVVRTATLFRTPGPVNRRDTIDIQHVTLPEGYGFPAEVMKDRSEELGETLGRRATRWLMYDPDGAELLAALYETAELKPSEKSDAMQTRHRVTTAADAWSFGLKKHLGLVEHRYRTDLPAAYDEGADKKWPLVVFLHGAGERGHDLAKVAYNGPPKHAKNGKDFPFVLVSPQCDAGSWWSIAQVNDLVTEAMNKYNVDPDRVYLTGLSMGGYGSWATAAAYPERFAAVAPVCGGGSTQDAAVLATLPIWAFHGDADGVVPPSPVHRDGRRDHRRRRLPVQTHHLRRRRPQQLGQRLRR